MIFRAREALGLGQEALANESGVSLGTVKRAENNDPIRIQIAIKLTKFFIARGKYITGPTAFSLAQILELVLSKVSPRRGRMYSNLEFTLDNSNHEACLVKELTSYPTIDGETPFLHLAQNPAKSWKCDTCLFS